MSECELLVVSYENLRVSQLDSDFLARLNSVSCFTADRRYYLPRHQIAAARFDKAVIKPGGTPQTTPTL